MPSPQDTPAVAELQDALAARDAEIADLQRELEHWRTKAITGWSSALAAPGAPDRPASAASTLVTDRDSLSWRVNLSWRVRVPLSVARRLHAALSKVRRKVTGR